MYLPFIMATLRVTSSFLLQKLLFKYSTEYCMNGKKANNNISNKLWYKDAYFSSFISNPYSRTDGSYVN